VLRCWEPRDAPLLKEAIDSSLDHLRAWMAWAHAEPQALPEKAALLRRFRGQFDLGRDFVYGIFDRDEREVLGGTGLHTRAGEDAYEIGYWIRASHVGRGLVPRDMTVFTLFREDFAGTPAASVDVDAYDILGERVL